jgi:hypothetical protein
MIKIAEKGGFLCLKISFKNPQPYMDFLEIFKIIWHIRNCQIQLLVPFENRKAPIYGGFNVQFVNCNFAHFMQEILNR